jgi:hypothetical protein
MTEWGGYVPQDGTPVVLRVPRPVGLEYRRLPDSPSGRTRYRFHR